MPGANPINTQVRAILGGQGVVLGRFTNMLTFINKKYAPSNYFYGIGIAPYFGLYQYQDQQAANGTWTTLDPNITAAQALQGMTLAVNAYGTKNVFADSLVYGSKWGLKLEMYEGGEDSRWAVQRPGQKGGIAQPGD